ncbi:MAG TPA: hypothetical protein VNW92_20810 [Polyangiaceae bacterium]|jgi:hypothetical protein|nr:hypothetical protein [Polyangiaceae bacterium]
MRIWRALLVVSFIVAWPGRAHAYAWMIRHGYAQCVQCHIEPSGSGPLTEYGHAMGEILLRTRYRWERHDEQEAKLGQFLFGAIKLPEQLELGGEGRVAYLFTKVENAALQRQLLWMQLDGHAAIQAGSFVAVGTLGYAPHGALGAALTRSPDSNVVSREHWLGAWLDESHEALLRAGRMDLPFGIRTVDHTLWAPTTTRTDINDSQQYGLAAAFVGDQFRTEAMGIIGSFQLRPDAFRERGYSAYAEYLPTSHLALGASSTIVHVKLDKQLLKEEWRHAHGLFSRWGTPWEPLVLLTEWDYIFESPKYMTRRTGVVGYLQADLEATQGVHFMATGEANNVSITSVPLSWAAWLSYAWFFAPHADIRLDNIYQSFASTAGRTSALSFMLQGHVFL